MRVRAVSTAQRQGLQWTGDTTILDWAGRVGIFKDEKTIGSEDIDPKAELKDELTKMGKEEDVFPLDPGKSLFLFD